MQWYIFAPFSTNRRLKNVSNSRARMQFFFNLTKRIRPPWGWQAGAAVRTPLRRFLWAPSAGPNGRPTGRRPPCYPTFQATSVSSGRAAAATGTRPPAAPTYTHWCPRRTDGFRIDLHRTWSLKWFFLILLFIPESEVAHTTLALRSCNEK